MCLELQQETVSAEEILTGTSFSRVPRMCSALYEATRVYMRVHVRIN